MKAIRLRKYLLASLYTAGLAVGSLVAAAQDKCSLLKNGDFESQVNNTGPTRLNNMNGGYNPPPSTFGGTMPSEVAGWESATGATPEYYARNANGTNGQDVNPDTGWWARFIPYDPAGNNNPAPPAGSVGLGTIQPYYYNQNRVSEYITQPLPVGQLSEGRYYAQFRVQPGDRPRNSNVNDISSTCGVKGGFGLVFSNGALTPHNTVDFLAIPSGSKTVFNTDNIEDVTQWKLVGQQFTVDAGDVINTVTAGLFDPDPNNTTALVNTAQPNVSYTYKRTYFLLDQVELFRIPNAGPWVLCSNNTGMSAQLGDGCPIPGATYAWYEGFSPTPTGPVQASTLNWTVQRTQSAIYTLVVTLPNGSTSVSYVYVEACPCGAAPEALPLCVATGNDVILATRNTPCPADTYSWNGPWGSGRFTSTQLNPTLTAAQVADVNYWGDYELTVTHADRSTTISYTTLEPLSIRAVANLYSSGGVPVPEYGQVCQFTHVTFRGGYGGTWSVTSPDGGQWQDARVTPAPYGDWTMIPNSAAPGRTYRYDVQCTTPCYDYNGQWVGTKVKTFTIYSVLPTGTCVHSLRPASGSEAVATAYPNPVNDVLHLPEGVTNVVLLNSQGKAMQRSEAAGQLDVRNLPAGLYNLQMQQSGKLINQHIEVKH
jgi:hypothetical protein